MMKKIIINILKFLCSFGLIFFLYQNISFGQIKDLLADVSILYLIPIAFLLFLNTIISAKKWQLFLHADGVPLPLFELTISYMSGTFCNLFLPSNIGGDTYRVYDIAKQSNDAARSAASVFADRLSGFVALVTLSLLSSIYASMQMESIHLVAIPFLLFIAFTLVLVALVRQDPLRKILHVTRLDRYPAVERISEKLFLSFSCYGSNRMLITKVMMLSFTFQLSVITVIYLMACSLGAEVAYFYFIAFVPLIMIMEALPISIFGIGVRDYGYVFFFTQVGMSDIETRTLAIYFTATAILYSLVGGLFFMYKLWRRPQNN